MGSSFRKNKQSTEYMSEPRNFGVPIGQVTNRESLSPNLFMRVGTRVGNITAYYEHVNPPNFKPSLPAPPTPPPIPPVIRKPTVLLLPPLEQTLPLPPTPTYDVPKSSQ